MYDPMSDSWTPVSPMPVGLQFLTAKTSLGVFERIDERFNRVRYRDYSPRHLISEEVFDRLMAIYEHDVRELEQAEGRELSTWFDFASLDPSIRAPIGTAG